MIMGRIAGTLLAMVFLAHTPVLAGDASLGRVTILLSNDDGYDSLGLRALVEALAPVGEIIVAAPAVEQSAKGHSLILRDPIMVSERKQPHGPSWYAIDAPPASCVRLALESLLEQRPDIVISGINRGDNLGATVYHSGTLGAAREAALSSIPALAVSMRGDEAADYATTAAYVRELIADLRSRGLLKPGLFLNVNVPAGGYKGVRVARLSMKLRPERYERRTSPRGRVYFWPVWEQLKDEAEGTDVWAFVRGFITVTPMVLDTTDTQALEAFRILETSGHSAIRAQDLGEAWAQCDIAGQLTAD